MPGRTCGARSGSSPKAHTGQSHNGPPKARRLSMTIRASRSPLADRNMSRKHVCSAWVLACLFIVCTCPRSLPDPKTGAFAYLEVDLPSPDQPVTPLQKRPPSLGCSAGRKSRDTPRPAARGLAFCRSVGYNRVMSKKELGTEDELRPEYNLSQLLKGGVRGKYADRYREGTNLVLLAPDVAEVFTDEDAVNEALRLVIQLTRIPTANSYGVAEK